jgi:hypothetical protein
MSRRTSGLFVVLVSAFVYLGFVADSAAPVAQAADKADPDQPPVLREIDLTAIYSTSGQRKLINVQDELDDREPEWNEPYRIGEILGRAKLAPTLAIVRGENIKEAVRATARHVRLKKLPAAPVGPDDKSVSKKCWLFVYLGSGPSSPVQWQVYPPTVYGTKVQFSYYKFYDWFLSDPELVGEATADDHAYEYWVPLGTFDDPGALKAELVELRQKVKAKYPAKKK